MKNLAFIALVLVATGSLATANAADPVAGKEKSKPCVACHGDNGAGISADFPKLAGQHRSYLERVLKDYKSGARKNPIMSGQVATLNPRDMADLAAYYASLPSLVQTKH